VDGSGHLFVSTIDRVYKYLTSGAVVDASLISGGRNSGVGLALDGQGHLFLANNFGGTGGNLIGEYLTTGEVVNASFITGLHNPTGLAIVVPEPSVWVLMTIGAVVIGSWRLNLIRRKN
jgi:hypothetical protein